MKLTLAIYLYLLLIFQTPANVYFNQLDEIEKKNITVYEKNVEIDQINDFFITYEGIKNKKITCIGDSITYGNGGIDDGNGEKVSYCNYLSEYLDSEVVNLGIGGAAIADYWDQSSLILRWQQIPEDSDVIIIFAGINDYFIGKYGDIEQKAEKTYCGDTYRLFRNIKENYKNSKVFVVLTYKNESENWEQFKNNNFKLYLETQKKYADEFGFETIDLYDTSFFDTNDLDIKDNFVPDGIHPNDDGNKLLARRLAAEISVKY